MSRHQSSDSSLERAHVEVAQAIEELRTTVEDARSMPMSQSAVVNRAELLEQIDELQATLAEAFTASDEVFSERDQLVQEARNEAERIVAEAYNERERLVSETEVYQIAKREADNCAAPPTPTQQRYATRRTSTSTSASRTSRSPSTRRSTRSREAGTGCTVDRGSTSWMTRSVTTTSRRSGSPAITDPLDIARFEAGKAHQLPLVAAFSGGQCCVVCHLSEATGSLCDASRPAFAVRDQHP